MSSNPCIIIMASLSITMAATTTTFSPPFFPKTAVQRRLKTTDMNRTRRFHVSCNVASDDTEKQPPAINIEPQNLILPAKSSLNMHNVDRRNLLLGLGGLYSTVNLTTLPSSLAAPVSEPITAPSDLSNCHDAKSGFFNPETVRGKACCPPVNKKPVKDFVFPTDRKTRTRPALHRLTPEYKDNFKKAIKAMKDLPDDHPHSWKQQAKIHCAYCNGGYTQIESGIEYKDTELQVHNSWLFFPFHRWYLYFFERIMGKLINDPTFALPYWNWDNPAGMDISLIFEEDGKSNPLFDGYRDAQHLPPAIVDLDYKGSDRNFSCLKQISDNLSVMNNQMIRNAKTTETFFGGYYVVGMDPIANGDPSVGSIEAGCHTAIHRWVGNSRMPNNEDLGNFYSAGYDPLFYVHHANVDRLWTIWKGLKWYHTEPRDVNWKNASFVFYDENEELVRVYNKDCVKIERLKYKYEKSDTPWEKSRANPRFRKSGIASMSVGKVKTVEEVKFPVKLDGTVKVLVKRPFAAKRTSEEKEAATEMLILKGIDFDGEKFVKFDVYVNDASEDDGTLTAADSEFAGSFAQLPHNHTNKMPMKSGAKYGLTELLEDIEAEEDEVVLVSIVPKSGCEDVTISEIKIELVDHTD